MESFDNFMKDVKTKVMGLFNKKKLNQVQRKIWRLVKAVMVPIFLLLIKVFIVILLITIIASLFYSVFDYDDGEVRSSSEKYTSSSTDSVGGIDVTTEIWQLSRAQIKDFIENYDSTDDDLKQKMLDRVEEGIGADDFDNFLDEMKEKAEKWKDEGYTTLEQIAEDYVGDDTAKEWANNIENKMQETARDADIIKAGEEDSSTLGDGYVGEFTSKLGK